MSFQAEDGFLYGVDFSFDQDTPPRVVAQFPPIDPGPPPPLINVLRAIPAQSSRTIRVVVEYFAGGGTHIDLFKPLAHTWQINKSTSTSLAEIIAQCHGSNENGTAWGFSMTSFDRAALDPQFGADLTLKWWLPRARIFQDASHRITLYINCEASMKTLWQSEWAEASRFCHDILLDFVHTMEHMDRQYKTIESRLAVENHAMLFVLRMLHSQVLMQCRTLDTFRELYDFHLSEIASHTQATIGTAVVTTKLLEKITAISNQADRMHIEVKSLVLVVEALLELLSPLSEQSIKFGKLDKELRAISRSLISKTEDLVPRLETKLRFLELNRNIRESTSLWLLSLFAAIFLPFSLASSLLSMQTRLADLNFLLYDFCGVIVFFGSLALVVVFAIKQFAKRRGNVHGIIRLNNGINMVFAILGWIAVVVSFLIGMIVDVELGLRVLYLAAAATAGTILLSQVLRSIYRYSPSMRRFVDNSRESFLLGWNDIYTV